MIERLQEDSFIAQRIICDACKSYGSPSEMQISSKMLNFARFARTRYHTVLEKTKNIGRNIASEVERKKRAKKMFNELQAKRTALRAQSEAEEELLQKQMLEVRKALQ